MALRHGPTGTRQTVNWPFLRTRPAVNWLSSPQALNSANWKPAAGLVACVCSMSVAPTLPPVITSQPARVYQWPRTPDAGTGADSATG